MASGILAETATGVILQLLVVNLSKTLCIQKCHVRWHFTERSNWILYIFKYSGQLSSVDRDYGWAHDLTHNIGTHQIHHLFIKIPHYHLEEATAAFRKSYPHLVRMCNEPILYSFFRMFRIYEKQRHISDDTKVHWFNQD